jgi:glucosamine--fructose-6-phosphate aminotransferase (isomerizing)
MPAIVLAGDEHAQPSIEAAMQRLREAGASVVLLEAGLRTRTHSRDIVAIPQAPNPLLQPVVVAQATYPFLAALARARGKDPDRPAHLGKITRTV